jgi:hypothetical protein
VSYYGNISIKSICINSQNPSVRCTPFLPNGCSSWRDYTGNLFFLFRKLGTGVSNFSQRCVVKMVNTKKFSWETTPGNYFFRFFKLGIGVSKYVGALYRNSNYSVSRNEDFNFKLLHCRVASECVSQHSLQHPAANNWDASAHLRMTGSKQFWVLNFLN